MPGYETCHWSVWWPYCLCRRCLAHLEVHLQLWTLYLLIVTMWLWLFLARVRQLSGVMAQILKVILRILFAFSSKYFFVSIYSARVAYKHARSRILEMAAISNQIRLIRVLLILVSPSTSIVPMTSVLPLSVSTVNLLALLPFLTLKYSP